jgi:gas vesicle protein
MELDNTSDADFRLALLAAFGCGVLTGVAVALLCAPARGRETRHWMADRSRIAREHLRDRNRRAMEIVRRDGIRGLLHWQQTEDTAGATGDTVAPAPSVVV